MPSPSSSSSGFALWAVLQRPPLAAPDVSDPAEVAERLDSAIRDLAAAEVVTRGIYDVSGLRADADLMVCLCASVQEDIDGTFILSIHKPDFHRGGLEDSSSVNSHSHGSNLIGHHSKCYTRMSLKWNSFADISYKRWMR